MTEKEKNKVKLTLKQKIGLTLATLGTAAIVSLGIADRLTAEVKTIKNVESKVKIIGYPTPFTAWDAYHNHDITYNDGSKHRVRTNDFHYPLVKKLIGYKTRHPQPGDKHFTGGITGGTYTH